MTRFEDTTAADRQHGTRFGDGFSPSKFEKVQYQAALAVTGAWQGSSRVKLYEELGWESLSDRRMSRRVLQIHKIIGRKTPQYLRDKMPPNRNVVINLPNIF